MANAPHGPWQPAPLPPEVAARAAADRAANSLEQTQTQQASAMQQPSSNSASPHLPAKSPREEDTSGDSDFAMVLHLQEEDEQERRLHRQLQQQQAKRARVEALTQRSAMTNDEDFRMAEAMEQGQRWRPSVRQAAPPPPLAPKSTAAAPRPTAVTSAAPARLTAAPSIFASGRPPGGHPTNAPTFRPSAPPATAPAPRQLPPVTKPLVSSSVSFAQPTPPSTYHAATGACPMCSRVFSMTQLEAHVDACLDSAESNVIIAPPQRVIQPHAPSPSKPISPATPAAASSSAASSSTFTCSLCNRVMSLDLAVAHVADCVAQRQPKPKAPCKGVLSLSLDAHRRQCTGDHTQCPHCHLHWLNNLVAAHTAVCPPLLKEQDAGSLVHMALQRKNLSADLLTVRQTKALKRVETKSKSLSNKAQSPLLTRFRELNHSEFCMKAVTRFIRDEAPMVIHLDLSSKSADMLDDTHYRNCHEVRGFDPDREAVERKLFGNHYNAAPAFERVKYGCLNCSLDPNGVSSAHGYGDSYLLLRNDTVRARVTMAPGDSFDTVELGTFDWCCHVLAHSEQPELDALVSIVTGKQSHAANQGQLYKELQIHGPVRLVEDVTALYVNARHATDSVLVKRLEAFRKRTGTEIVWLEVDQRPPLPDVVAPAAVASAKAPSGVAAGRAPAIPAAGVAAI